MSQLERPPDKTRPASIMQNASLFVVGGEVGCLTLLIVFAAVFGGLYLDKLLGTKPVLTIIFVLGSAPLSLALTFWIAMREVKRTQSTMQSKLSQTEKIYDEEDASE